MRMKVVILGCGYLGYNLALGLQDKYDVTAVGINTPYHDGGFRYFERDCFREGFGDGLGLEAAVVIDAIGMIGNRDTGDETTALLQLKQKYAVLLNELERSRIRSLIFFSSGGTVYGSSPVPVKEDTPLNPGSLYAKSKVMLEDMIREYPFSSLILRLSNPYGGKQDPNKNQGVIPILIRRALKGETFLLYSGKNAVRDYFYIDDLCRAVDLLIQKGTSGVLNVGSGKGTSLGDLIRMTETITGKAVRIVDRSEDTVVGCNILDVSEIEKLTGWKAETALETGMRKEEERIRKEEKL